MKTDLHKMGMLDDIAAAMTANAPACFFEETGTESPVVKFEFTHASPIWRSSGAYMMISLQSKTADFDHLSYLNHFGFEDARMIFKDKVFGTSIKVFDFVVWMPCSIWKSLRLVSILRGENDE